MLISSSNTVSAPMLSALEADQSRALSTFLRQHADSVKPGLRVLAIRSNAPDGLVSFDPQNVYCWQTNRVAADRLEAAGLTVHKEPSGPFDLCLIEATRDKEENLFHIARGWSLLAPAGRLIISASNSLGGESLIRRIREAGFPIQAIYSKAKCRVAALERDSDGESLEAPAEWLAGGEFREIADTGLVACAGLFSAHAIDAGTRLLSRALDTPLDGQGADFGAGYGALSHAVLTRSPAVRSLDLYDAEWKALEAARRNLAPWKRSVDIRYHRTDLAAAGAEGRYAWVVMNPPFHAGPAAVPSLGQTFIGRAAGCLKRDGVLWLVANRHLPYESILNERFEHVASIVQEVGYKVYRASRPKPARARSHPRPPRNPKPRRVTG
jgi:16S rRNA (guanine1207-N2)-methyltransferase